MPANYSPQNVSIVAATLASKGWTDTQIAGVIGNMKIESGFDPNAYNMSGTIGPLGGGHVGIIQWDAGRQANLVSFAQANGLNPRDVQTQALFINEEATNPKYGEVGGYQKFFANSDTPEGAAASYNKYVERSGEATGSPIDKQRQDAAAAYAANPNSPKFGQSGGGLPQAPADLASQGYTTPQRAEDGSLVYTKADGSYVSYDPDTGKYYQYSANDNLIANGKEVIVGETINPDTNAPITQAEYDQLDNTGSTTDGGLNQDFSSAAPPAGGATGSGGIGGAGNAVGAGASLAGGAGCLGGAGGLAGMLAGSAIGQAIGGLGQAAVMGAVNGLLSGGGIQGALSGALGGLGGALGNSIGAALGGAAGTLGNTLGGIAGQAVGGALGAIAAGQNPAQALSSSAFGALMSAGSNLIPGLSGVMPAGLAQAVVGGFAGVLGATAQGYPLSAAVRFGLSGGLGGMIANVSNNMTGAIAAGAIAANGVLNGTTNLTGRVTIAGSVDLGRYASLIQMTAGVTAGNRLMVGAVTEAMSMKFGNGVGGQGAATRNMQDAMTFSVTTLGQNVNAISADMIAMGKWDATNMMRFMQPGNVIAQLLIAGLGDIIGLTDIMLLNNVPVAGIDNPLYDRVSLAILTAINDKTAIGVVQSAFNMTTKIDNLGDLCLLSKMMPTSYKGMPVTNFREMGVHLAVMGVTQAATIYDIGVAFSQVETSTDLNHISQLAQPLPPAMGAALLQTYGYGGGSMGEQTMADFIGTPAGYVHADTAPVIAAAMKYIESHPEAETLVLLTTMLNNLASGVYTDLGTAADSTATPPVPGEDPIITVPFPTGTLTFSTLDDAVMAFIPLMEAEQQKLLNTTDPKLLDWINKLNLAWNASCAQLVRENNNLLMHQIDIFNLPPTTPQTGMMFAQGLDYFGTQTGYGQAADYIERVASNDVYGDAVKYAMRQSRNAQVLANLGINVEKYKLPQSQYYREPETFYQSLYTGNLPATPQFQKTAVFPRTPADTYILNRDQKLSEMGYSEIPMLNNQKDELYADSLWMDIDQSTLESIGQTVVRNIISSNIVVKFPDLIIKDSKGNPIKFGEIRPTGLILNTDDIFVVTMLQLVNRALYGNIITTKFNNPFNTDQMVYGILELLAQVNGIANIDALRKTITGAMASGLLTQLQQIYAAGALGTIPGFTSSTTNPGQGSRSLFDTAMDRNDQTVSGGTGFGGPGPASVPR